METKRLLNERINNLMQTLNNLNIHINERDKEDATMLIEERTKVEELINKLQNGEMEKLKTLNVSKVIDNTTERAEKEAAKYYESNESFRQMVFNNIREIDSVEELEDYLTTLNTSEQGLLEEIETQRVSPYAKNEYERELMIARLNNELTELKLYRELALKLLKEMEELKNINTIEELEVVRRDALLKLEEDGVKVPPQDGYDTEENQLRLKEYNNLMNDTKIKEKQILNKGMETMKTTNVKTRRTLSDEEITTIKRDKSGKRFPDGTEMMVGERMVITRDVSVIVAYELSMKRARREYFEVLSKLPNSITGNLATKELILGWAKKGVSSEVIIDRIETIEYEMLSVKKEHERLTQELMNDLNYDSTVITGKDAYNIRRRNDWT